MAIFKRNNAWYIDYYVEGQRKREAVGTNRKLAEKVLAKRKVAIAENRFLDVSRHSSVTFEGLAKAYLEYARTNKLSWKRDRLSIKTLAARFAGQKLERITPLDIEEYKNHRRESVSPATVNRELACLKHMYSLAIQWGMVASNPVKKVRLLRESAGRIRYLSKEEIQALVSNLTDELRPVVTAALHTGMRRGELLALTWADVDLKNKLIFVRNSKNGHKREIPIARQLREELMCLPKNTPHVFQFMRSSRVDAVRRGFEEGLRRTGITDFRFHDLRHTFASHLVMAGADLLTVKELLGHKSIAMTLRYAHLNPDHKRKAVESLQYFDGHNLDTRGVG